MRLEQVLAENFPIDSITRGVQYSSWDAKLEQSYDPIWSQNLERPLICDDEFKSQYEGEARDVVCTNGRFKNGLKRKEK